MVDYKSKKILFYFLVVLGVLTVLMIMYLQIHLILRILIISAYLVIVRVSGDFMLNDNKKNGKISLKCCDICQTQKLILTNGVCLSCSAALSKIKTAPCSSTFCKCESGNVGDDLEVDVKHYQGVAYDHLSRVYRFYCTNEYKTARVYQKGLVDKRWCGK